MIHWWYLIFYSYQYQVYQVSTFSENLDCYKAYRKHPACCSIHAYTYTYRYRYTHRYTYTYTWTCISICACKQDNMHLYIYIYACAHHIIEEKRWHIFQLFWISIFRSEPSDLRYPDPPLPVVRHHADGWEMATSSQWPAGAGGIRNMIESHENWVAFIWSKEIPTMWGPLVIRWFIRPNNYSYKYHKP